MKNHIKEETVMKKQQNKNIMAPSFNLSSS